MLPDTKKAGAARPKKATAAKYLEIKSLKNLFTFLYGFIASATGDDAWDLEPSEAQDLAEDFQTLLLAFPARDNEWLFKFIEKWMPLIAFCATLYAVSMPKIKHTRELMKAKKAVKNERTTATTTGANAGANAGGNAGRVSHINTVVGERA